MYVGIDCGTQGTKAIVWNEGQILGQGYTAHNNVMDDEGQREQSPELWFEALVSSINQSFIGIEHLKKQVKGIGISGQQHGLVLLDIDDKVIRDALLWCDTRPQKELSEFVYAHDINFVEEIGIQVPVAFTIGKLLWIKHNDPENFRKIKKIMLPHDYLNWKLTGRYTIEAGDASGSGWFDTKSKSINEKLLTLVGIDNEVDRPELIESQEIVGTLQPSVAELLGFNSKVIVSSGGGDNMMAAIGTGNVDEGQLTISLGTSGTLFSHCKSQVDSRQHPDLNAFCSSTNGYLPLSSTMNVTTANNQILKLMNSDIGNFDSFLASSSIGSDGLMSLPFFNGARLPNIPNANGAIVGITSKNLTQPNLLRSTVEAVTFNLEKGVSVLKDAGVRFDKACVIGGGANSHMWRQMIADTTNLELWSPLSNEAAAVGAAIQAYWAYENQYNSTDILELCRNFIAVDPQKSILPNQANVSTYAELSQQYHQTVSKYMEQFI